MVTSIGHNTIRVTIIYGWDSVARDLGLLTISGIVGKLILRHIVHVTLLIQSQDDDKETTNRTYFSAD